jgi:hypothetical protein
MEALLKRIWALDEEMQRENVKKYKDQVHRNANNKNKAWGNWASIKRDWSNIKK